MKRNKRTCKTHNVNLPFIKQLHNIDADKGLPIGNLTSQFFGNVYLNELDQFVKHQLKVKHYVRYVDDFVLLSNNPQQLELWQTQIQEFLADKLSLRLKEVAQPKDTAQGVDFLGYIIRPHYNLVRRRILGNMYNRLLQWQKENIQKVEYGEIIHLPQKASDKIDSVFASYIGHFKHAKSHKIIKQKFSQFGWLDLLFFHHDGKYKSKRHTKKAVKLIQQWDYFRFHYQPFVLLMQVGCYFVALKKQLDDLHFTIRNTRRYYRRVRTCVSARYKRNNIFESTELNHENTVFNKKEHTQVLHYGTNKKPLLRGGTTWQSPKSSAVPNRLPQSYLLRNDSYFDAPSDEYMNFKQSKLKSYWFECHQVKLSKILKALQKNSISYVVVTQQGYVNNKLRKRKVSQIYISNNLNPKEAI